MKIGIGGFASVSAAFGRVGQIQMGNPGLDPGAELGEDLRRDVLGSRRKMLFIEGSDKSLDQPLYALLFPQVSVNPKAGCREVMRAVTGLRSASGMHHREVYGLIDRDDRSPPDIADLEKEGLYALEVHSGEGLYYCREVREAVATRQSETYGGVPGDLLEAASQAALIELAKPEVMGQLLPGLTP